MNFEVCKPCACGCSHCLVVALEKKLKAAQELSENFEVGLLLQFLFKSVVVP